MSSDVLNSQTDAFMRTRFWVTPTQLKRIDQAFSTINRVNVYRFQPFMMDMMSLRLNCGADWKLSRKQFEAILAIEEQAKGYLRGDPAVRSHHQESIRRGRQRGGATIRRKGPFPGVADPASLAATRTLD